MIKFAKKRLLGPAMTGTVLIIADAAMAAGLPAAAPTQEGYMNSDLILLVLYVLLALVFSFLCSVAEAVLLSITPSYIAGLRDSNPKLAALLKRLKQDNVDQSLAAILTLNTIAHTVGAIGSGSKATLVFGSAWFGVFSAVMTLMILFLSEIIPKTIGAVHWRKLTGVTAHFVNVLTFSMYPLIRVSEALTRLISRGKSAHVFNRDEFIAMVGIGEQAGKINEQESRIIHNLFRLGALTANDIMTPRTVIAAFPEGYTVAQALDKKDRAVFSRLPLYEADIDHITGFILRDDLLLASAKNSEEVTLVTLKRKLFTVNGEMKLSDLLTFFLDNRQQIMLVKDEFGGTKGLVTLEDVVETLLGLEIVDEMDTVEDMQALARQQWAKRARTMGLAVDLDLF